MKVKCRCCGGKLVRYLHGVTPPEDPRLLVVCWDCLNPHLLLVRATAIDSLPPAYPGFSSKK